MLTLVLQVLLAASATAAMAAPASVICTAAPDGTHRPGVPAHVPECACGLLCHAGIVLPEPSAPSDAGSIPVRFADPIERAAEAPVPAREPRSEGRRQARAPPSFGLKS